MKFEVIRAISSDGVIVIPEHTVAIGKVLSAEHAKLAHHGGKLAVAIEGVPLANGQQAPLRAVESRKGRDFTSEDVQAAISIAVDIFAWPFAPLLVVTKGDEAIILPGTRFTAYVDGDVEVDRASLESAAPPRELNREVATIFVYRGNRDKAPKVGLPVSCGRVSLAQLTGSMAIEFEVAPGQYWVHTEIPSIKPLVPRENRMVVLDAVAGKSYYLEVASVHRKKWIGIVSTIRLVDELAGAEEVFKVESAAKLLPPANNRKYVAELSAKPKGVKD